MMTNFFKGFGKGLLYVLLFPFILVGIVLYAVFGLFVFIFQLFKLIYLFFTGRTLYSDLEEDIAAKAALEKEQNPVPEKDVVNNDQLSLYPSDSPIYTSNYSSPFEVKNEETEKAAEEDVQEQDVQIEPEEEEDIR